MEKCVGSHCLPQTWAKAPLAIQGDVDSDATASWRGDKSFSNHTLGAKDHDIMWTGVLLRKMLISE